MKFKKKELEKKLFIIFKKVLGTSNNTSIAELNYQKILSWDSLKHIMLIMEVEKVFKIKVNEFEISELLSFKKIIKYVEKN